MAVKSFSSDFSIGFFDCTEKLIRASLSSSATSSGISSPGSDDSASSAFSDAASVSRSSSKESERSSPSLSKALSSFCPADRFSTVPQAAVPARTMPATAVVVRVLRSAKMTISS